MHTRSIALLLAGFSLAACDQVNEQMDWVQSQLEPAAVEAPAQAEKPAAPVVEATPFAPIAEQQRWWKPLNDPLLDLLADQLVAENLDMKIAVTRVAEARGLDRVASGGLLPAVVVSGNASRGNLNALTEQSVAQIGFDAAYEVDLFGRVREGVNASEARVESAIAGVDESRNTMLAELARAVVEWRQAQHTIRVTKALLTNQDKQIDLFSARVKAGLVDATQLERAQAQRAQTATQLPIAEASAKTAQYQIERLLGNQPEDLSKMLSSHIEEPLVVPVADDALSLSIDNVRQRPDVRVKLAELIATQADAKQAEAELWPRLSLGAFFGVQKSSDGAFIASNPLWRIASALTAPLLNFGSIRGNIDASDARAQQAALAYENTALIALQETRTALSDYLNGLNAVARQEEALTHRKTAIHLANQRFTSGLTDMTDLTTAQAELDQASLSLITQQGNTAIAFIRLQKALGTAVKKEEAAKP